MEAHLNVCLNMLPLLCVAEIHLYMTLNSLRELSTIMVWGIEIGAMK